MLAAIQVLPADRADRLHPLQNALPPGVQQADGQEPEEYEHLDQRGHTESGLGDIVLGATYAAYSDARLGVDFTGKVKLGTADEDKGLGTGEHDFIFLVDLYQSFDRITGFGGIGFHILGDAPGLPLDNVWSVNLGFTYKVDERDSAGLSFDARQRVASDASPQRELTGFFVRQLDRLWKAQLYALIGLADGSPDWGFGLSAARPF